MSDDPVVDVIMSTLDEERDVAEAIACILGQDVPLRLTVVDGGSTDGTVALLQAVAAREPRVRVIADGVRRTLPAALNLALERTTAPLVAKVDGRTFLAPRFLAAACALLAEDDAAAVGCVGGRPEQFGATTFGQALAFARTSRFGVGGSGYADPRPRADVDTVQCGVYRRSAIETVGGFDDALQFGEDEELNWRLRQAGWRIVRDASIRFRYLTRSSWPAAFRQYRNYGRARAAVAAKHPRFLRPHHLAPSAAVAAGAALAAGSPFFPAFRSLLVWGTAAYLSCAVIAAHPLDARPSLVAGRVRAFAALHAGYGIGLIEALAKRCGRGRRSA